MGIEAAEGPADGRPRADHGAIHVDRQARQRQALDRLDDEGMVELDQRRQRGVGELAQPVPHRARRRQARQSAEACDQRIAGDVAQVLQAARPDVQQGQHEQGESAPTIIPARRGARGPQPLRQVDLPQVAAEQFQPAVRGQFLVRELDVQRALDHPAQARYAQSHQRGLLCVGSDMGMSSLKSAQGASLFLRNQRSLTPSLFSDWG
jgi:hypothetical protein